MEQQQASGWISYLAGALTVAVPAVAGAVVIVLKQLSAARRDRAEDDRKARGDTFGQQTEIINRQEKHIARQDEQIARLNRTVTRLFNGISEAREAEGVMVVYAGVLLDMIAKMAAAMREDGHEVDDPPPLPERPRRVSILEEFEVRTAQQDTVTLAEVSQVVSKPAEPPK